jgi:uncharacterized NAD(P)/FAD-binding protein YdhS
MRARELPPCDITIIEPRTHLGAGIAYSAEDPLHRVNITAERMAALADDVEDFDVWLKDGRRLDHDPEATYPGKGTFPARELFGTYVGELLKKTAEASVHVAFRHVQSYAEKAQANGGKYRITCASGEIVEANLLVLATGHPPPRLPWPLNGLPAHQAMIANPWVAGAVSGIKPSDRVLIVGTGLTMGDMIATLRRQGHAAPLTAISRRGLTPKPRTGKLEPIMGLSFVDRGHVSQVLQMIRAEVRKAKAAGQSWSDVFDSVRQQNSAIWTHWSEQDQRRFQRHLRPFWDVHRFQAAPQIHALVNTEQAAGRLTIFAAAMTQVAINRGKIEVGLRRRGQRSVETKSFDAIINCTGASGPLIGESQILTSLKQAALIEADVFGTGIDVDPLSRAKTSKGINESLFVLGPAIRGCLGEISGALEIAIHAQIVAKAIASDLKAQTIAARSQI